MTRAATRSPATATTGKTQSGTFSGAIFKLTQTARGASKGLATLSLVESAFKGAPAYASCKREGRATDVDATAASSNAWPIAMHGSAPWTRLCDAYESSNAARLG